MAIVEGGNAPLLVVVRAHERIITFRPGTAARRHGWMVRLRRSLITDS
jgi:hypothetical protein